jgi:hypothetical protein
VATALAQCVKWRSGDGTGGKTGSVAMNTRAHSLTNLGVGAAVLVGRASLRAAGGAATGGRAGVAAAVAAAGLLALLVACLSGGRERVHVQRHLDRPKAVGVRLEVVSEAKVGARRVGSGLGQVLLEEARAGADTENCAVHKGSCQHLATNTHLQFQASRFASVCCWRSAARWGTHPPTGLHYDSRRYIVSRA